MSEVNTTEVSQDNSAKLLDNGDEILQKFDAESRFRDKMTGAWLHIWKVIAAAMSLFHLFMAGFGTMPVAQQRILHLTFAMTLAFMLYPSHKKAPRNRPSLMDSVFVILAVLVNIYLFINIDAITMRAGKILNVELIFGFILVVLLLEATRRCLGNGLPVICILFMCYAYFGPYLPGKLAHKGYTVSRIMSQLYISSEGVYGVSLGVSCTYIFLFILFGAFLSATGLSVLFNSFSISVAGRRPGGPAKVSIFASGLLGMINGSAPANVVTTGAFTIPLMTKIGYPAHFAASVEAVASTGGQIMPPVMGAAAFIMAEFLGLSYKTIMLAAIVPATLYYGALWINVDLCAKKLKLRGLREDEIPDVKTDFKKYGLLILPVLLLLYFIFSNYTPYFAAFYSILALIALAMIRPATRLTAKQLFDCLATGARSAVSVAIATAVVGIIVGIINLTGLGLQLSGMIIRLTNGSQLPTMFLTMIACLILGMGLPTSAAYIVAGTVAAPVLIKLGFAPLIAHFFVFYFAIISVITPPVAIASYAAAGMSGSNPNKVGWSAVLLGSIAFIVPFMFAYTPGLLLQDVWWRVIINVVTAFFGIFMLAASVQGYWKAKMGAITRIACVAGCFLLVDGGTITDVIGLAIFILCYFTQAHKAKKLSGNVI